MSLSTITRRQVVKRAGAVGIASSLAGCQETNTQTTETDQSLEIGVGSWSFAEQYILGQMFYAMLSEQTEHQLFREIGYGSNAAVFEGFTARRAYEDRTDLSDPDERAFHVYADYTGTMWQANPPTNEQPKQTPESQYTAVKAQMETEYDLSVLDMTPFQNSFAFAMKPEDAETYGIETLSDLAASVNSGNYELTVAMQQDFYDRTDGWTRLKEHYGFNDEQANTWENQQDGIELTEIGAEAGYLNQGQVDIGLVYTTDPQIDEYGLTIIEDDQQFWPYYNIVPVVANEVAVPDVKTQLNSVIGALTSVSTMRRLNGRVINDGADPAKVARSYLESEGLL